MRVIGDGETDECEGSDGVWRAKDDDDDDRSRYKHNFNPKGGPAPEMKRQCVLRYRHLGG